MIWIALAWWAGYAVIFASGVMNSGGGLGERVGWGDALDSSLGGWMIWVPMSVGLYIVARRFPAQRGYLFRSLSIFMLAVIVVVLLLGVLAYATSSLVATHEASPSFVKVLTSSLYNNFLPASAVIGLANGLVLFERAYERSKRVSELEASLGAAKLEALRAQLNPHFLFNALNSAAELVHDDPELADRMLMAISALLRDSLAVDEPQERSLGEEIALVENYLMIEKIRLGDRLQVRWYVEDACLDFLVPVLALQILVENAVIHVISKRTQADRLIIRAYFTKEFFVIEVENRVSPTGGAYPPSSGRGLGLRSVSDRLQLLYGDQAQLSRSQTPEGRHRVELRIRRAPSRSSIMAAWFGQ